MSQQSQPSKVKPQHMDILLALAEETWIHILSFCHPKTDTINLCLTSSFFLRLMQEPSLWEKYFVQRFGKNAKLRPYSIVPDWRSEYKWRSDAAIRRQLFNENPYACIQNMLQERIIHDPHSIIYFLRYCGGLSHKVVYAVVQQPGEYGLDSDIFTKAIAQIDLRGKTIVQALRIFSAEFGDLFHQQGQEMALTALSENFYEANIAEQLFSSSEQVFRLLYSLVMLNTDAHHPQVMKKMSCNQFIRNLKAIDIDLPENYLTDIYRDITLNEIEVEIDLMQEEDWGEIVKMGWMKIKDCTGVKKRWVILTSKHFVIYKKKRTLGDESLMVVRLYYSSALYSPENMPTLNREQIVLYTDQAFYLIPLSQRENEEWKQEIAAVLANLKEESNLATSVLFNNQEESKH